MLCTRINYKRDNHYCCTSADTTKYIYDSSFIKLKEVRISYDLPTSLVKKTRVLQGINLSAYATNLFCISNYPFFDPEVTGANGANAKRGIETGSFPMCRSYGFNLKVKF